MTTMNIGLDKGSRLRLLHRTLDQARSPDLTREEQRTLATCAIVEARSLGLPRLEATARRILRGVE